MRRRRKQVTPARMVIDQFCSCYHFQTEREKKYLYISLSLSIAQYIDERTSRLFVRPHLNTRKIGPVAAYIYPCVRAHRIIYTYISLQPNREHSALFFLSYYSYFLFLRKYVFVLDKKKRKVVRIGSIQ